MHILTGFIAHPGAAEQEGGASGPGTTVQCLLPPIHMLRESRHSMVLFSSKQSLSPLGRRRPACHCLLTSTGGPERSLALVSMTQHSPLSLPVGRQSGRISDRSLENASDLHRAPPPPPLSFSHTKRNNLNFSKYKP